MKSKVDRRIFVILGIFTVLFEGPAIYGLFHEANAWKPALIIAAILAPFWIGAISVNFEVRDSEVRYRSAYRKLSLPLASITEMELVSEYRKNAPQGVPRFYLKTVDGKREALNVKVLPIAVVREFCELLKSRGVKVSVADAFVAKRMASQIFGS